MIFKVSFTSNILKYVFYFTNEFQSQKPAKAQKREINMGKFWHHIYKNVKNKCISSFTFQHFNTDGFRKGKKTTYFFIPDYKFWNSTLENVEKQNLYMSQVNY